MASITNCGCKACSPDNQKPLVGETSYQEPFSPLTFSVSLRILKDQLSKFQEFAARDAYNIKQAEGRIDSLEKAANGIFKRIAAVEAENRRLTTGQSNIMKIIWQVEDRCKPLYKKVNDWITRQVAATGFRYD